MNNKIRYLRETFLYWAGRFDLPHTIKIRETKDEVYAEVDCEKQTFYYNKREVPKLTKTIILEIVLHEIGHLINDTTYKTEEEQINTEYFAEQFAINTIKKYYPELLDEVLSELIKTVKSKTTKTNKIYQEAYKKLPEMKKYLKRIKK